MKVGCFYLSNGHGNARGLFMDCERPVTQVFGGQQYCDYHGAMLREDVLREAGFVYFAQREHGDLIKIGFSQNPQKRCEDLKARLLATEPGGRAREHRLHLQFAWHRREGEWFEPADELIRYIRRLQVVAA